MSAFPRKQTLELNREMSALCQKQSVNSFVLGYFCRWPLCGSAARAATLVSVSAVVPSVNNNVGQVQNLRWKC